MKPKNCIMTFVIVFALCLAACGKKEAPEPIIENTIDNDSYVLAKLMLDYEDQYINGEIDKQELLLAIEYVDEELDKIEFDDSANGKIFARSRDDVSFAVTCFFNETKLVNGNLSGARQQLAEIIDSYTIYDEE